MSLMSAQLVPYCAVLWCPLGVVTCKRRVIRSLCCVPLYICCSVRGTFTGLALALSPCTGLLQCVYTSPQPLKPSQSSSKVPRFGARRDHLRPITAQPRKPFTELHKQQSCRSQPRDSNFALFSFSKPRPHPHLFLFYLVTVSRR